jgi:hypothetical protein
MMLPRILYLVKIYLNSNSEVKDSLRQKQLVTNTSLMEDSWKQLCAVGISAMMKVFLFFVLSVLSQAT